MRRMYRPRWPRIFVGFLLLLVCASAIVVGSVAPAFAQNDRCESTQPPNPVRLCDVVITNGDSTNPMRVEVTTLDANNQTRFTGPVYLRPRGTLTIRDVRSVQVVEVILAQEGTDGNWLVYENTRTLLVTPSNIAQPVNGVRLIYIPTLESYFSATYE